MSPSGAEGVVRSRATVLLVSGGDPTAGWLDREVLLAAGHRLLETPPAGWPDPSGVRVPEVIVIDASTPMGASALAELVRDARYASAPRVALMRSGDAAGCDADEVLRTPITPMTLLDAVEDALATRRRAPHPAPRAEPGRAREAG